MTDLNTLLEVKKIANKKRPNFMREGSQNSKKIGKKWRRPKGLHSKMRHEFAGHRAKVRIGYGSPVKLRHFDKEGKILVHIENIKQLENFDAKIHKLILSSKIGQKKKILIFEKAEEKGFKFQYYKDPKKIIEEFKKQIKTKKDKKEAKEKIKKEKKTKTSEKKTELEEKVLTAEDKRKEDHKEMEKIITKRE